MKSIQELAHRLVEDSRCQALAISREMKDETLNPHADPAFLAMYEGEALRPSDMAALIAGYRNSTLLEGAWGQQRALSYSIQAAIGAYESEKAQAKENLSISKDAIAKARQNDPEKFIGFEGITPSSSAFSQSVSAGAPIDQLASAENSFDAASANFEKAEGIYGAGNDGFLAQALPMMRDSRKGASVSLNSSLQLISYMDWLATLAQDGASSSISALRTKLAQADASTSQGLSSYIAANASLAASISDSTKAAEAASLGEKFRLSMSAKARSDAALALLEKKDISVLECTHAGRFQ